MKAKKVSNPTVLNEVSSGFDINVLMNRLAELEKQIKDKDEKILVGKSENDIRPDHYVAIMNGLRERLNLSRGKDKEPVAFESFGEIKRVQYSQLLEILDRCENFYKRGYFFILDPVIVKKLGYEDISVLSKEQIESVIDLTCSTEDAFSLYKMGSDRQKSVIVDSLIEYIRDGKEVNGNLVRLIEKESKIKITEKAEEAKEYAALGVP